MSWSKAFAANMAAKEAAIARREAEQTSAINKMVEARVILKARREAERKSLKELKACEKAITELKNEAKLAKATASNNDRAKEVGSVVEGLLSTVESLRKDESELIPMEKRAIELGMEVEFKASVSELRVELTKAARLLDSKWAEWNRVVELTARDSLSARGWHKRMKEARKARATAKNEWLNAKGDVVTAIERLRHAQNRLEKCL